MGRVWDLSGLKLRNDSLQANESCKLWTLTWKPGRRRKKLQYISRWKYQGASGEPKKDLISKFQGEELI